jgi:hypothetical protein
MAGAATRPYIPPTVSVGEPNVPMAATPPVRIILRVPPDWGETLVLAGGAELVTGAALVLVGAGAEVVMAGLEEGCDEQADKSETKIREKSTATNIFLKV